MSKKERWPLLALAGLMVIGFVLRLLNIGAEPLWGDEILSLDIMTHFPTVSEMLAYLRQVEFHPPLYYVVMRGWIAMFGTAAASIRFPSVLFGVAAIPLVYVTAKRMFGSVRGALAAAAVFTVLPLQLEYGQEARPYAMIAFFALLAVFAAWEHLRTGRTRYLLLYAFAGATGLYLHYSFIFVVASIAAWRLIDILLFEEQRFARFTEWFAANALIAVAFSWWADAFLYKVFLAKMSIFGLPRPQTDFRRTGIVESVASELLWMRDGQLTSKIEILSALLFKSALIVAVVAGIRGAAKRVGEDGRPFRRALLFMACLYAGIIALFVVSPLSEPDGRLYYRYIISASLPLVFLLGAVVSRITAKQGAALIALFAATLVPTASVVLGNDQVWNTYFQLEQGASYINEHISDGEIIIISRAAWRTNLNHYLRPDLEAVPFLPLEHFGMTDPWSSRATLGIMENEAQVRTLPVTGAEVTEKLDRLMAKYQPTGVWLYWFGKSDKDVHAWFAAHGWRHAFRSLGPLFPLDHYVRM